MIDWQRSSGTGGWNKAEIKIERLEAAAAEAEERGIQRYAWWQDGVEMVGTCGTTLKDALAAIRADIKP